MFIVNPNQEGEFFLSEVREGFEVFKEITEEDYNTLELNRSIGKMYKIKNIEGKTFEEIFQEIDTNKELIKEKGIEEYILELEYRISKIELGV